MSVLLEIQGITKAFGKQEVLKGIDLKLQEGEFLTLLGPSGCGKSTLLRILLGLESADQGKLSMHGMDLTQSLPGNRNMGVVFQSYALFPNLNARENIAAALHRSTLSSIQKEEQVAKVLELVGLQESAHKYPSQLSGGQQQRIALARALVTEPRILLLDEPLSALDAKVRERLRRLLKEIQHRTGVTTVLVTHDQDEAMSLSDRIAVMEGGQIVQLGTPEEIYDQPIDPFVADFVGQMNFRQNGSELQGVRPEKVKLLSSEDAQEVGDAEGTVVGESYFGSRYVLDVRTQEWSDEEPLRVEVEAGRWNRLKQQLSQGVPRVGLRFRMQSFGNKVDQI
jgi:iron(III) transport system ATP-binding protein